MTDEKALPAKVVPMAAQLAARARAHPMAMDRAKRETTARDALRRNRRALVACVEGRLVEGDTAILHVAELQKEIADLKALHAAEIERLVEHYEARIAEAEKVGRRAAHAEATRMFPELVR